MADLTMGNIMEMAETIFETTQEEIARCLDVDVDIIVELKANGHSDRFTIQPDVIYKKLFDYTSPGTPAYNKVNAKPKMPELLMSKLVADIMNMENGIPDDTYKKYTSENGVPFDLLFEEMEKLLENKKLVKLEEDLDLYFSFMAIGQLPDMDEMETLGMVIKYNPIPDEGEKCIDLFMFMMAAEIVYGDPIIGIAFSDMNPDELSPMLVNAGAFIGDFNHYRRTMFQACPEAIKSQFDQMED